jgi:hypothetical protein
MIDNALVFLSLFWFAVQPIADLADAPIVALDRLLDQQQLAVAPDRRPRRALLHLSYSYAAPFGPAILVTQDPEPT